MPSLKANPKIQSVILNLPYFENKGPITAISDLESQGHLKKIMSNQGAGFDSINAFMKYFFVNRFIASSESSENLEKMDMEFLEKAGGVKMTSEKAFFEEYITPILNEFGKESDPKKLLDLYKSAKTFDSDLPSDYYLPTRTLTSSIDKKNNESLNNLTKMFGEGDEFGKTDVLNILPKIDDIVKVSFDEYDDYIDSIKDPYGDDIPEQISDLMDEIEEQREKEKPGSSSYKRLRFDFEDLDLGSELGKRDFSILSYLDIPLSMSLNKGKSGSKFNMNTKAGRSNIRKLINNKSYREKLLSPGGYKGTDTIKNVLILLIALAEEQGVDFKIESGGSLKDGTNINGNYFSGYAVDSETGEEKTRLDPKTGKEVREKKQDDLRLPYMLNNVFDNTFFSDEDIKDVTFDNGGPEKFLQTLLKNKSKKYVRQGNKPFSLNKEMFVKSGGGGYSSSDDLDFSEMGGSTLDVRNFIENYRKQVEGNSDNYYIDYKLVDALDKGDIRKVNRYLFTNRSGDVDVRKPDKAKKTGLRYEHTVPVLFLARLINMISSEWKKKSDAGEVSESEATEKIKEYSKKVIDKLYTITWLNLIDDSIVDNTREKSDVKHTLYDRLGLKTTTPKQPIFLKSDVSIEDFYDKIEDVTEDDIMMRYHMKNKPVKLNDFFGGGTDRSFDNIKKSDASLDIGIQKESKQPMLTNLLFGYYG